MRISSLVLVALPAIWAAEALSQDSSDETAGRYIVSDDRPMPPVRVFRGPFRIEPDTATFISMEEMRARGLFNAPDSTDQADAASVDKPTDDPADAESTDKPTDAADDDPTSSEDGEDEVID